MPVIESKIDVNGAQFRQNRDDMLAKIAEFRAIEAKGRAEEESKREKFHKRGQLLPRERVHLMLDRGSPWLELQTLAGYKHHDDKDGSLAGGNTIIGIGYVSGVRCIVSASNFAIKGGTMTPWGVQKGLRIQEIAYDQKLPTVAMIESGGAYMPGLSDYVIMVRKRAKVFLAGPPLLKAATGEVATDEDLGGAEMHSQISGVSEYLAENDADGIRIAREVVKSLNWNAGRPKLDLLPVRAPLYDIDELVGVVPVDYRKPYDCREVIARIVDGSEFLDFKYEYDQQTICGRAVIHGHQVGIIGNNGPITTAGATKAGQFIQLCCQANIPLVYLMNTTGYMVGSESEQGGIVKHGSKMIQAVANATVPQITLVIGASFGAGNYGMCGRGFGPDFIFAWPNSRTAVMGGEQAAKVMSIVTRDKWAKEGKKMSEADENMLKMMEQRIIDQFDRESTAFAATARLFDDGLIDPRDTRKVLGLTLSVCKEARLRKVSPNTFGVARM